MSTVLATALLPAIPAAGQSAAAGMRTTMQSAPVPATQVVARPQTGPAYIYRTIPYIVDADTIPQFAFLPLYLISYNKGRALKLYDMDRLIYNVKKVYPIAKEANRKLAEVEQTLKTMHSSKEQSAYIKKVEADMKAQYTPVLRNMTFSQGKILIKLIDRETDNTSYQLVKQLRGSFSAFFWQSIARIFGANLKDTYKRDGEDQLIEQIIMLYEAGMI